MIPAVRSHVRENSTGTALLPGGVSAAVSAALAEVRFPFARSKGDVDADIGIGHLEVIGGIDRLFHGDRIAAGITDRDGGAVTSFVGRHGDGGILINGCIAILVAKTRRHEHNDSQHDAAYMENFLHLSINILRMQR